MAELLLYSKDKTPEGDIIEKQAWKVPRSKAFPWCIKYSLNYIHNNKRVLAYDNERSKGPHMHYFNKEEQYTFIDWQTVLDDFEEGVKQLRKLLYGNEKD